MYVWIMTVLEEPQLSVVDSQNLLLATTGKLT